MAEVKAYRVVYEIDESGHWIASVPAVRGCHTYGRSLSEARSRIREALGLFVTHAAPAKLVDDVRLPAAMKRLLLQYRNARAHAERDLKKPKPQSAGWRSGSAAATRLIC
jgi:predicted RNase H-like HicB family nuclease